jgi:hypothetical protein
LVISRLLPITWLIDLWPHKYILYLSRIKISNFAFISFRPSLVHQWVIRIGVP